MKQLLPEVRDVGEEELVDLYDTGTGPWLRAGFVASVDGVIALDGVSQGLSSSADKAVFRALRAGADAVLVGAGTARAEDYGPVKHSAAAEAWRASHGRDATTPLVVVSGRGRLDPAARMFAGEVLLVTTSGADVDPALHADVLRCGDSRVDLRLAVEQLRARGLQRLLCEGGPSLLADLLSAGLVDELCLTTAGVLAGAGPTLVPHPVPAVALELTSLLLDPPATLLGRWAVRSSS